MKSPNDEVKRLTEENKQLKQQLELIDQKQKNKQKRNFTITKKGVEWWVGSDLKNSFYKLYSELPNVSKDTFAEFSASIVKRLTKVGLIGFFLALLPSLLIFAQTIIFSKQTKVFSKQTTVLEDQTKVLNEQSIKIDTQNDLITQQNEKITKQVFLEEASRRNNLVLLMDNILAKVNSEITDENKKLSTPLIGRIQALSQGFQPYYFLDDSTNLTKQKYSPERGQLLLALANSGIDTTTMDIIFDKATFSSAYLKGAKLDSLYLRGADLREADLQRADLREADLQGANLRYADLQGANLRDADLQGANLRDADLQGANLRDADLQGADLKDADLQGVYLWSADLQGAYLRDADLQGADLWSADLQGADLTIADLQGAYLWSADLQGAYLWSADLQGANLRYADLQGADLRYAKLSNAIVSDLNWLLKLKECEVKGYEKIIATYIVVDSGGKRFGQSIYRLQLIEDIE